MRRKFFTLLVTLSALVFVAACGMWVRSYWRCEAVWWQYGGATHDLASADGRIVCTRERYAYGPNIEPIVDFETTESWEHDPMREDGPAGRRRALGFEWSQDVDGTLVAPHCSRFVPRTAPLRLRIVAVPWWAIAALAAVLPFRAMRRGWRGRQRARAGACRACGYDLRASPDRCPECGLPAVGDTAKSAIYGWRDKAIAFLVG